MNYSRRGFVVAAAIAAAGVAAAAAVLRFAGGLPRRILTAAEKQGCGLTVGAVEGPYWVSGMPELVDGNLNSTALEGIPLSVAGHVYDGATGSKAIADAVVEIWHADSSGSYHPNGNGPATGYAADQLALRGFVKTDASGAYAFSSIYPGEYTGRARHFHFKIAAPGKPVLTTQLIVPAHSGDQLTFDSDDIAEGLPNCQLLAIDETVSPAQASFDFRV
jgi:protocatechuate 3,4-dioxygenase beta subunit